MSTTMEQVKERPIAFSSPMVLAIREGRKTQTRRAVKRQQPEDATGIHVGMGHPTKVGRDGEEYPGDESYGAWDNEGRWGCPCPYGKPGDRLYVTEHWSAPAEFDAMKPRDIPVGTPIWYRADPPPPGVKWGRFRVGRFMCRWMSRITLPIVGVHVEPVQDITECDAFWEGVNYPAAPDGLSEYEQMAWLSRGIVEAYAKLWDAINGAGAWGANPLVWAITFPPTVRML